MAKNKISVSSDLQNFTILHNEFIESELLTSSEKLVFIALKRHLNNERHDSFPSLNTICKYTRLTKPTVSKAIQGLQEKKIIKVEHRTDPKKGNQSNLYTVYDYKSIWKAGSKEEIASAIEEIEEQRYIDILRAKGYKVEKEKESTPGTDQSSDVDPTKNQNDLLNNDIKPDEKNQSENERYSLEYVRQIYDYDTLAIDYPADLTMIDAVMMILHDTLNTQSKTIRIGGENLPSMVVISRLLKLDYTDIMFAIRQYNSQSEKVKNPEGYLLTILYKSKVQKTLYINNQVQYHMNHPDTIS